MATLILLGAGASFGSVDVIPEQPPLGNQLFDRLEKLGGIASTLPQELKDLFNQNFEEGMAKFYRSSDGNIMRFQRELAHYLALFSPGPNNIYLKLIESVGADRVTFSSLNYDLLFEISAAMKGFFTVYDNTPQKGGIRLLKIHGSCNFWPDFPSGTFKNCTFAGNKIDIQAPIRPVNQRDTIFRCVTEDSLAPALAMFAVGKEVKISPDYTERQYALWKQTALESSKIIIVGVKVHEVDEHIWNIIGQSKAWTGYFGFETDRDAFLRWQKNHSKKNAYFFQHDFESSIGKIKKIIKG